MKKILLTGATGRVGANLVPALLKKGYEIRAFIMKNDPQKAKLKNFDVEIFEGCMWDTNDADKAVAGCDILIHLAAAMLIGNLTERQFWDINVTSTFELARVAVRHKLSRIMLASTDATYTAWNYKYLPMDEKHPQEPFFIYGLTKQVCENIVNEARRESDIPTVIMRFVRVLACDEILRVYRVRDLYNKLRGYPANPHSIAYRPTQPEPWKQLDDLMEKCPDSLIIPLAKDLRSWREQYVDVRDLITGILLCLEKDEAINDVFNLTAPGAATWAQGVKYLSSKTGQPYIERIIENYWDYEVSYEKARRILGYKPQYDVTRMIDDALRFKNGEDIGVIPAVI